MAYVDLEKRKAAQARYRETRREELRTEARERAKRNRNDPVQNARLLANSRRCDHNLKRLLIAVYSDGTMQCVLCGEARMACLSIDHINGGGNAHRRSLKKNYLPCGNSFYRWLKQNSFPEGYRTLCMNCQFVSKQELLERGRQ